MTLIPLSVPGQHFTPYYTHRIATLQMCTLLFMPCNISCAVELGISKSFFNFQIPIYFNFPFKVPTRDWSKSLAWGTHSVKWMRCLYTLSNNLKLALISVLQVSQKAAFCLSSIQALTLCHNDIQEQNCKYSVENF